MNSLAPQIGFDRFIQLDWVKSVLNVRCGTVTVEELNQLLESSNLGKEAIAKTRTKLNALGLQPKLDLRDFIDRGRAIVSITSQDAVVVFAWGAAISTYPFFGKIAELVGRLTSIQGDCSVSEIHRRMSEVYGDREVTKRATQAVLQTYGNWGVSERIEKGRRITRLVPTTISNDELTAWLIEAIIRYVGKPIFVSSLQSQPVLFPFTLTRSLAYVISNSPNLVLQSEGPSNQFVALRNVV